MGVMHLELKDIKGGVLEQEYTCSVADFPELRDMKEQGGPEFRGPLAFHLRFQKSGQIVELEGSFTAEIILNCGRCLQDFSRKVSESFALTFSPVAGEEADEEDVELDAEELGLITYKGETIELTGSLQEQLVMAVPIGPVCREACRGLCPECGRNLNDDSCHCERRPFNNKFSALAGLKLKD